MRHGRTRRSLLPREAAATVFHHSELDTLPHSLCQAGRPPTAARPTAQPPPHPSTPPIAHRAARRPPRALSRASPATLAPAALAMLRPPTPSAGHVLLAQSCGPLGPRGRAMVRA